MFDLTTADRLYEFSTKNVNGESMLAFIEEEVRLANLKLLYELKQMVHDEPNHDIEGLSELYALVNIKIMELEQGRP